MLRWIIMLLIGAKVFFVCIGYASPLPASSDWKAAGEDAGIHIFKKEIENSDLLAFKGSGVIDAPLDRVASVVLDESRAKEWVVDLEETKRLRWINDNEFVQYDHFGTPIVVKDRDFVTHVKMEVDIKARKVVFETHSIDDPTAPRTNYVRGNLMHSKFVLSEVKDQENGKFQTLVEGEIHVDPMGSIPKWVANSVQKDWPMKTLKSLRKQVRKDDIQIHPKFGTLSNPQAQHTSDL
jgi:hypothetical protein